MRRRRFWPQQFRARIRVFDDQNGDVSLAADAFVDDLYVKDGATLDLAGTTLSVAGNIYSVDESVYEAAATGF